MTRILNHLSFKRAPSRSVARMLLTHPRTRGGATNWLGRFGWGTRRFDRGASSGVAFYLKAHLGRDQQKPAFEPVTVPLWQRLYPPEVHLIERP